MCNFKYFIFDLDGTTAYTIADLTTALNRILDDFSFPHINEEKALENINHGARNLVRGCLPEQFRDDVSIVDSAFEKFGKYYGECYLDKTCLYPNVAEGIAYLKQKGARLAVLSNKLHSMTVALCDSLFPEGTFDIVIGQSNAFPSKPDPTSALHIAKFFGADPEKIAFVGDSDVDIHTAKNAGMHPIGVSWGYRPHALLTELGAERIIFTLEDFYSLI